MRPARPDELDAGKVEHSYLILYPSGRRFTLHGLFCAVALDGHVDPAIRVHGVLNVLDPRAVIVRDGLIIWEPRGVTSISPEIAAWLEAHPEWPRVATEASS